MKKYILLLALSVLSFSAQCQFGAYTTANSTGTHARLLYTGNLGIGTAASAIPSEKLHVVGNTLITGNLIFGSTASTGLFHLNSTTNNFVIRVNATDRFRILNSNGFVGIGNSITTPIEMLHVGGNILSTGNILATGNLITTAGIFNVNGASNSLRFQTNGTDQLTILSNGNVGIGTSSPQAKLDVYSSATLGSATGNFVLLNKFSSLSGSGGNYFNTNTWLYRDAGGSDWLTTRLHEGISIDGSYNTPNVDTRTWWERDPFNNIQSWGNANQTYLTINQGNVGIGTTTTPAGYKLAVGGKVIAEEVVIKLKSAWPDYVFASDFKLLSLGEVEQYINQNKHLPGVPSAAEVSESGIAVGEMNAVLLQKIEELTLYVIELKKTTDAQQKQLDELKGSKK